MLTAVAGTPFCFREAFVTHCLVEVFLILFITWNFSSLITNKRVENFEACGCFDFVASMKNVNYISQAMVTLNHLLACVFFQVWSRTQGAVNTDENPEGKPPVLSNWHAHQGSVVSVEYLVRDQGALLLSASEDCTARLWTLNGQFIGMFGQVGGVVQ